MSEGNPALRFGVHGANSVMFAEVINCEFFNCVAPLVIDAGGYGPGSTSGPLGGATNNTVIRNCVFNSSGYGCLIVAYSQAFPGNAAVNATISANIFKNASYQAIFMYGGGTNISRPKFINNTVSRSTQGIKIDDANFEPVIRNNIFVGNSNAVHRRFGGSVGSDVGYNCFHNNTQDFVTYPGIYGAIVQTNHNGDPSDAFFNIFLDPRFLDTNTFLLSNFSPCIDAGDPAIADVCFQFSRGSAISDIGAYGGPDACGWLTHGFAPVITGPPASQSSCVGGSAAFKVTVQGSAPLEYRWYFNGNLLAGETNAQLNLANLQTNRAGLYSVAVSNAFGSVTSAPARLLVFDACVSIHPYAGLTVTGMVGRTYVIDGATNLNAAMWTPLATNTLSSPTWLFVDTNTPLNPMRVFRVRLEP